MTRDEGAALGLLADPGVQLVTLTVTGAGYHLDKSGALNLDAEPVKSELGGGSVGTIYGYLHRALAGRRKAGGGPVTVLSCDNMRGNGALLRGALASYLDALGDAEDSDWVAANVSFPSSMVDRITPVTPSGLPGEVEELFGVAGDASLMAESYIQWVVEDDFAGRRPPLDRAGVEFVKSVHDHEEAKIRLLNGGHMSVAYRAALRGHEFVWQAMRDGDVADFYDRYIREEAIPAIKAGPIDLASYHATTAARFANPNLDDTVARICRRGTTKVPEFVLPTVSDSFDNGVVPRLGLAVIAAWYEVMRCCAGGNGPIEYVDDGLEAIRGHLGRGGEEGFVSDARLWGDLPGRHEAFKTELLASIKEVSAGDELPAAREG